MHLCDTWYPVQWCTVVACQVKLWKMQASYQMVGKCPQGFLLVTEQ